MSTNASSGTWNLAFNARNYSSVEVAERFVFNDELRRLCEAKHTLVLGPRGSGKTTLFKMLTLPALEKWQGHDSTKIKRTITFYSVYIPTDILWNRNVQFPSEHLLEASRFAKAFSRCAILTCIFQSLLVCFQEILAYEKINDECAEEKFCASLSKIWELPKNRFFFDGIASSSDSRLQEVHAYLNSVLDGNKSDSQIYDGATPPPAFFELDIHTSILASCRAFSRAFPGSSKKKWALCFDELELAPPWFQELLFTLLRSTSQELLFKLSSSPVPLVVGASEASLHHDYEVIRLWNYSSNTLDKFSYELARSILETRFGNEINPSKLLGISSSLGRSRYDRLGDAYDLIKDLASWDTAVAKLLEEKGISSVDPSPRTSKDADTVLRKLKPIAALRHYYLKPNSKGLSSGRSRKSFPPFFSGEKMLYKLADGNPRRLIGLINLLIDSKNNSNKINISSEQQTQIYRDYAANCAA